MHPFAIIYICFALYSIVLLCANKRRTFGKNEYVFVFISFLVLMTFHVFVNTDSVEDLPGYKKSFQILSHLTFSESIYHTIHNDYLWAVFNKLTSYCSEDFTSLLLIYNIFVLGTIYLIAQKYSPSLPVSIVMFIVIAYDQSLFILRQFTAIACVFWTIPCIIKKRLIPYILLCIAAVFIHKSAIIWMPIYFLYNIKNRKLYISLLIAIIFTIGYICANPLILAAVFDDYYIRYLETGTSMNMTLKLVSLSYIVCYVLFAKKHIFDEGINRLCFIVLLLYTTIYLFAPSVGLIGRILKYYEMILILAVPITMSYMRHTFVKVAYFSAILIFQGYIYIRGLDEFWISEYRMEYFDLPILSAIFFSALILVLLMGKRNRMDLLLKKRKVITN